MKMLSSAQDRQEALDQLQCKLEGSERRVSELASQLGDGVDRYQVCDAHRWTPLIVSKLFQVV